MHKKSGKSMLGSTIHFYPKVLHFSSFFDMSGHGIGVSVAKFWDGETFDNLN